jgi:hypothetical protein
MPELISIIQSQNKITPSKFRSIQMCYYIIINLQNVLPSNADRDVKRF